jgi:hypothetical protein
VEPHDTLSCINPVYAKKMGRAGENQHFVKAVPGAKCKWRTSRSAGARR